MHTYIHTLCIISVVYPARHIAELVDTHTCTHTYLHTYINTYIHTVCILSIVYPARHIADLVDMAPLTDAGSQFRSYMILSIFGMYVCMYVYVCVCVH